jgi:hypothetical protein
MKAGTPWDRRLEEVFKTIRSGKFGNPVDFEPVLNSIENGNDRYLLAHDFPAYLDAQAKVDKEFVEKKSWAKKCLLAIAGMGFFSTVCICMCVWYVCVCVYTFALPSTSCYGGISRGHDVLLAIAGMGFFSTVFVCMCVYVRKCLLCHG